MCDPMWFGMIILFGFSVYHSTLYLSKKDLKQDLMSKQLIDVGIVYGILGLITGMVWANYTWGEPWSFDIKQNMAAIALLIYLAYFVLRSSINDYDKRYRIAAAYNIFAFVSLIPLLFVIPRLVDSLHPGSGGNPGYRRTGITRFPLLQSSQGLHPVPGPACPYPADGHPGKCGPGGPLHPEA